jgi:Tfp pilus assembly protein PilP
MRQLNRAKEKAKKRGFYWAPALFFGLMCVGANLPEALASEDLGPKDAAGKEAQPMGEATQHTAAPADKLPQVYNPAGKADPFRPFIVEQRPVEEKKKKKPKTYLESLDLSQLELTAIVISPKGRWAMVRDAKGVGFVIRKGTPIGINGGFVYQITENEVIIREEYRDYRKGQVLFKDIAKKLNAKP